MLSFSIAMLYRLGGNCKLPRWSWLNGNGNHTCDISIPDLTFGAYDPNAGSPTTQDATITYQCTTGTSPVISFSTATLEMAGPGTDVISYSLHQGTGGTGTAWTSTAPYTLTAATGSGQTASYSGSIPINQFVESGSYSQDLTMILGF